MRSSDPIEARFDYAGSADVADWLLPVVEAIQRVTGPVCFSPNEIRRERETFRSIVPQDLESWIERTGWCFFVHGDGVRAMVRRFSLTTPGGSPPDVPAGIWCWAKSAPVIDQIFQSVTGAASRSLRFACACHESEFARRNQFRIPISDTRSGDASGFIGRDWRRYVPGLYWQTFLAHTLLLERGVEPATISAAFGIEPTGRPGGLAWRLFSSAADWESAGGTIDAFLESDPRFFSIRRAGVPESATTREVTGHVLELSRRWP